MAEKTVEAKLKELFRLQEIDSEVDQIEILKGELPMEVSDLEDDIAGLSTRVQRLEGTVDELQKEVARYQGGIKEAQANIERYTVQLDDVKNNREFEALNKELEMQRLDIQLFEKKERQANVAIQEKEETLAAARERLDKKRGDLESKKVELNEIIEKTDKEEKKLRKESEKARENIEPRLLKAYDRVRNNYRNGLAVVTVERDSCGGCFNRIPPQVQLEISMRKKIIACEHCGRILVDGEIAGINKDEEVKS